MALALLPASAAHADEDYVEDLVKLLETQGYVDISVTRTLLGRVRIVAVNSKGRRELICNPRTGEVLRDILLDPDDGMEQSTQSFGGSGGGGDDHGGHGGGDHDSSESESDDDGDDKSGHGSSNDD